MFVRSLGVLVQHIFPLCNWSFPVRSFVRLYSSTVWSLTLLVLHLLLILLNGCNLMSSCLNLFISIFIGRYNIWRSKLMSTAPSANFQVQDWVYPKLQPYVQSSLVDYAHQRLSLKFFGSFRIVKRIGAVAYVLESPASSSIHLVFHVSQLKKVVDSWELTIFFYSLGCTWEDSAASHHSERFGFCSVGLDQVVALAGHTSDYEDLEYLCQQFPCATVREHPDAQDS